MTTWRREATRRHPGPKWTGATRRTIATQPTHHRTEGRRSHERDDRRTAIHRSTREHQ